MAQKSRAELWDCYVGRGVSYAEIAEMNCSVLTRQVKELKEEWKSDEEMSASEIARELQKYARDNR